MKSFVVFGFCALLASTGILRAEETAKPAPKPTAPVAPEVKEGTWQGKVTEKGDNWIRVKTSDGKSERFTPQWIGGMPPEGGLDKTMLQKIHDVKVGSEVTLKWVWSERMRVVDLTVTAAPTEAPKTAQ
jgi:hypothetical protein